MADQVQMISPPVYIYTGTGPEQKAVTVFGWSIADEGGRRFILSPIVGNPDGPGVGIWSLYYGEDPWRT